MSWLLKPFGRYWVLFAESRGIIPSLAVFVGYLALGIEPLALILLIRDATGSYTDAGWVAAAPMFFGAGGALVQGWLIEQYGPRLVLSVAVVGHVAMLAILVESARAHAPLVLLVIITGIQGACFPQLVATLRVIWKRLMDDPGGREAAYALVFVTFQLALIAGPLVVAILLPVVSRSGLLMIAALLAVCGTAGFVMASALRDWAGPERRPPTGILGAARLQALRTFLLVSTSIGFTQGVLQVSVPAFAISHHALAASGILLAAMAVGNLAGAFVYGGRTWPLSLSARYLVLQWALCLLLLGAAFASAITMLFTLLFLVGALLAAVSVTVSALIELAVPDRDLVEAFALNVTVAMIGNAAGTLSAGMVLQSAGYTWAMLLAGPAVAITGVAFAVCRGRTSKATASRASFSQQSDVVRG